MGDRITVRSDEELKAMLSYVSTFFYYCVFMHSTFRGCVVNICFLNNKVSRDTWQRNSFLFEEFYKSWRYKIYSLYGNYKGPESCFYSTPLETDKYLNSIFSYLPSASIVTHKSSSFSNLLRIEICEGGVKHYYLPFHVGRGTRAFPNNFRIIVLLCKDVIKRKYSTWSFQEYMSQQLHIKVKETTRKHKN